MASFYLIGLPPLPVQPCWAIQSNLAGLEVVMKWFMVVFVHWTNWIRLFRRAYEKASLVQSVCLSFSAATLFPQKNKQNSYFECLHFVHCRPTIAMQQLVALRALRNDVSLFYATYATHATQGLALRTLRS